MSENTYEPSTVVPEPTASQKERPDWLGSFALGIALGIEGRTPPAPVPESGGNTKER